MTAVPALQFQRLDLRADVPDPVASAAWARLTRRGAVPDPTVRAGARTILEDVRTGGARAVSALSARHGGGRTDGTLTLHAEAMARALDALPSDLRDALEAAIANVRRFAESQHPATSRIETVPGVELERRWTPLRSVGCYVPGGGAPYPSSLIMTVVPAQVAGVRRIVVASPADRDGNVDPVLAGAAGLLGIDTFLVAGGAQAIGALAFGIPEIGLDPVDRIVGPGNAWVTAAKLEVAGEVAIDLPAGPSEGLVLADGDADPRTVAADLITQAEHGPDSPAILVTTDATLADAVEAHVNERLATALRRDVLERALAEHGRIVLARDLGHAVDLVNAYAPEHLSIDVTDLEATAARITDAGSVFVGRWAPESAGDYATGANHVLPTGGLARACGPLAVETFGKYLQVQRLTRDGLATLRPTIRALAEAEGLHAHRDAVEARFTDEP